MLTLLLQVRDFILSHAATLAAALEALAAAAPQLAQQDWRQLESRAQAMGQQLLSLEQFIHLNQTGFVKIVKKHDKVRVSWCAVFGFEKGFHLQGLLLCTNVVCSVCWGRWHLYCLQLPIPYCMLKCLWPNCP
jgi:hypothetical protein